MNAVILIPALDPDEKLVTLIRDLRSRGFERFVVVDDGSAASCAVLFDEIEREGACVLHHDANLGKGAAIKTGLREVQARFPQFTHVVTVDADGQHLPDDILKVSEAVEGRHDHVVIGVRDLGAKGVPFKSRLGNAFSSAYFKFDTGMSCPDTQTGLRAIPRSLVPLALSVGGMRYEYEMNFLTIVAKRKIPLIMIPIEVVYENNNAASHFDAVRDSMRIYKQLVRFAGSSAACSAVDLGLFASIMFLAGSKAAAVVIAATVVARVCSGMLNFSLNRCWSFASSASLAGNTKKQLRRYIALFLALMFASAGFVSLSALLPIPLLLAKVAIDSTLFVISYFAQKNWVFSSGRRKRAVVLKGGFGYAERAFSKPSRAA